MTIEPKLLNPSGKLLSEIANRLTPARKTKPLWAKLIDQMQVIETREGTLTAQPGDYLCRGIEGEPWPQKADKLREKYSPSREVDGDGWERYEPKPAAEGIEAAQFDQPFRVITQWGELQGKANDYVVRSKSDPADVWIVGQAIFEASYEF